MKPTKRRQLTKASCIPPAFPCVVFGVFKGSADDNGSYSNGSIYESIGYIQLPLGKHCPLLFCANCIWEPRQVRQDLQYHASKFSEKHNSKRTALIQRYRRCSAAWATSGETAQILKHAFHVVVSRLSLPGVQGFVSRSLTCSHMLP
jgi:hypothetical protein